MVFSGEAFAQSNLPPCPKDQNQRYDNCFGTFASADGDKYVGEFKDGKYNGQGTYTFANGDNYMGEWKGDMPNGQGTFTFANGAKYVGEFTDGIYNGQFIVTYTNGDKYVGQYKDGKRNGQGTYKYADGTEYVGEFKDDKYNGQLIVSYPNGDSFSGRYQSEKRNGDGTYIWKDGSRFVGTWKDGLPTNDGIFTKADGTALRGVLYSSAINYVGGYMTNPDVLNYDARAAQQLSQNTTPQSQQNSQTQLSGPQPAAQQAVTANDNTRRLALVIGIDRYQNIDPLKKAVNDSKAVSKALQKIGYDVVSVENPDRRMMSTKLQEFQGNIKPGDTAFFFFAGHGVALGPDNILLAADVPQLEPGQDDIANDEGFSVDNIIRRFQKQGAKTAMLVLDACRNNPFETDGTRSVGNTRGLAKQDAPEGVFVLFSAGLGQEALDRLSDEDVDPNSVFTRRLVPALLTPSITHNILAKRVQKDVSELAATVNVKQQPAYYDQIVGEIPMNNLK